MRFACPLLCTAAVALVACTGQPPTTTSEATASAALPTSPPVRVLGKKSATHRVEVSQISHNRTVYRLFADSSVYDSRTHVATFANTDSVFYQKDGKQMAVRAPAATIDQRTQRVTLSQGVLASTEDGARLTCDQLIYDDATQRVHGSGNVRLTRRDNILRGERIDADLDLQLYKVTGS